MRSFRLGAVTRWLLLVAAAAAALGGGGASASGASASGASAGSATCSGKCALGEVAPTSVGAGASESFTFTLTNEASPQSLGSADLTPPSAFVVQSAPAPAFIASQSSYQIPTSATVGVSGGILELRGLSIPSGGDVTVSFTATVPCAGGGTQYSWLLEAKQANNFNGPPGNDFTTDPAGSLSTTVNGACTLEFVSTNEPASTVAGDGITNVAFSQALGESGAPVEVEALDGDGNPLPNVGVSLSLAAAAGGGTGSLSPAAPSAATDQSGDASFPGISIDQTGYYQLEATAPGFPQPAYSTGFQITTTADLCAGGTCSGQISAGKRTAGLSVSVSGAGGGDILSVGQGGLAYSCPGYTTVSDAFGVDVWTSDGSAIDQSSSLTQQITIQVPKYLVNLSPNNGAAFYQICYASTQDFHTQSGGLAPQLTVPIPGSNPPESTPFSIPGSNPPAPLYAGLLPDCSPSTTAPCVASRNKNGGDVLITFDGAPGDFWGQT